MSWLRRLFSRRGVEAAAAPAYESPSKVFAVSRRRVSECWPVPPWEMLNVYVKDPTARAAIDYLADQAVGIGFYTTARIPEAKEVVDEFCERVGVDELLQTTAREVIGLGNSFWLKVREGGRLSSVVHIPPTNVIRVFRAPDGTFKQYELVSDGRRVKVPADRIVHFRWNPVNNEAFGSGLLRTVCESLELGVEGVERRRPVYLMKALMQEAMVTQFLTHSSPNQLWIMPDLPASELDPEREGTVAYHLKHMPPWGARWISNREGSDIKIAVPEVGRGFEAYVENLTDEFILGLQTPLPKLIIKRGFTEASAKAALELVERKVVALQRFIKRVVERQVFSQVVLEAGFDPREAAVRLNWGVPERPELTVRDVLDAFEKGVIDRGEARRMLADMGWRVEAQGVVSPS